MTSSLSLRSRVVLPASSSPRKTIFAFLFMRPRFSRVDLNQFIIPLNMFRKYNKLTCGTFLKYTILFIPKTFWGSIWRCWSDQNPSCCKTWSLCPGTPQYTFHKFITGPFQNFSAAWPFSSDPRPSAESFLNPWTVDDFLAPSSDSWGYLWLWTWEQEIKILRLCCYQKIQFLKKVPQRAVCFQARLHNEPHIPHHWRINWKNSQSDHILNLNRWLVICFVFP